MGAGLICSLLLVGMVLAGARAMFISSHDLAVLLTMLLFASLLAVGFSLYGAAPMARRIERVREAARQGPRADERYGEEDRVVDGVEEHGGLVGRGAVRAPARSARPEGYSRTRLLREVLNGGRGRDNN